MSRANDQSPQFSPFALNIFFVVLIITGAAMVPLLSLQLNPTRYLPSLTISFAWPGASPRVIEQQVTSVIEGALNTVPGISSISSTTNTGSGTITVELDKKANLRMKRFEVASLIRDLHTRLPDRVTYPDISMNMPSNTSGSVILSYQMTGNEAPSYVFGIAEEILKPAIAAVEGVYSVDIYGATPRVWNLIYEHNKLASAGISPDQVFNAVNSYLSEQEAGGGLELTHSSDPRRTYITITGHLSDSARWEEIPVAKREGRIIMLSDLVKVKLEDETPVSYYRINGLNTVTMVISAGRNVNNVRVARQVKSVVDNMKSHIAPGHDIILSQDNTDFLRDEIRKNLLRALLSVVLLLSFALLVSRDLRYLLIIAVGLAGTMLISFIFYAVLRLEIHLYAMAGIAISFGMIISNIIIMTDHIKYHHNRRVGISLMAATLTTVGALVVIFFLDEASRVTLTDFAAVVIINLLVSLGVALFFVPSLTLTLRLTERRRSFNIRRKRTAVRISLFYEKVIRSGYRYKAVLITGAILLFGLPLFWLPDSLPANSSSGSGAEASELTRWQKIYNKTLGNTGYVTNVKPVVNKLTGGTLRLFVERVKSNRYYYFSGSTEIQRTRLVVDIGLSEEGLTVEDINDVCLGLENFIAAYSGVDRFTTSVGSAKTASVSLTFRPEEERTILPWLLKVRIEDYMNSIGSYHVTVYGVGRAFSNQVYSDYLSGGYSITMTGYNYDNLTLYAEELGERLITEARGRIRQIHIVGGNQRMIARQQMRTVVTADAGAMVRAGSDMTGIYNHALLYSMAGYGRRALFMGGFPARMTMLSDLSEKNDIWNFYNEPMTSGSDGITRLREILRVSHDNARGGIYRVDQQYIVKVAYDYIGNYAQAYSVQQRCMEETASILPLGYAVKSTLNTYYWAEKKSNYPLLLLVFIIIYLICAILLESLRQPLIVIVLIPFSFIGVFITFSIFKIVPDEGVFAAMILLSGLAVNSALFILDDYNRLIRSGRRLSLLKLYMKAFNGKIIPVLLTITSAIIGLVPFLVTGRDSQFWFALAAGAIGGMVFSIVGLILFQPLMLVGRSAVSGKRRSDKPLLKKDKQIPSHGQIPS